ncbi:MAG: TlpA disulfide reductase family protein [Planctomycetota bacterium]
MRIASRVLLSLLASAVGLKAQKIRSFEFRVETLDGEELTQEDFKDKVLLVDFWGTWCGPCRKAVPVLSKLYRKYQDQGLAILGLSYEQVAPERAAEHVRSFARKHEIPYPLAIGSKEIKARIPGFRGYPTMLFFGRGLRFERMHAGFDAAEATRIESWIKKALAGGSRQGETRGSEEQGEEKPEQPARPGKIELFLELANGGKIQIAGQDRYVLLGLVHPEIGPSQEARSRLEALAKEHRRLELHWVSRAGLGGPGALEITRESLAKVRLGKAYPAYVLFSPEGKGLVRAAGAGRGVLEGLESKVLKALQRQKGRDKPATRPSPQNGTGKASRHGPASRKS